MTLIREIIWQCYEDIKQMQTDLPGGNIKQTRSTNVENLLFILANNNSNLEMINDLCSHQEVSSSTRKRKLKKKGTSKG
jgi:hypothetical protein